MAAPNSGIGAQMQPRLLMCTSLDSTTLRGLLQALAAAPSSAAPAVH
jgi:hypothetical protein